MIKTSKLLLIAAIAAAAIASPAFAHSRHNGREAYAMVPVVDAPGAATWRPTDPTLSGGGSIGYNENLLKNQW